MDDFNQPVHPPTPEPIKRNIDGITNKPMSRGNSMGNNATISSPGSTVSNPSPTSISSPSSSPSVVPVAVEQPKTNKTNQELIPGLNTKPNESSFDQVGLTNEEPKQEIPAEPQKEVPRVLSAPEKPVKKSKAAPIIAAVLVALSLIGGAGYAYWQKRQEATNKTTTPSAPTKVEENTNTPTTPGAKASSKIDESLKKIDDTKEFQESDLSDTTLGIQ